MLLTSQEWEKLSPESRHKLNVLVQKVESFVRASFGSNHDLANMVLVEMGVLPNTACTPTAFVVGTQSAIPLQGSFLADDLPATNGDG